MKLFVTVVVFGLIAIAVADIPLTDEQKTKAKQYMDDCLKETGAAPSSVMELKTGEYSNIGEKEKCFVKCFLMKAQLIDENGNQNLEYMKSKIPADKDPKKVAAAMEKCGKVEGADPCDKAFNGYKCYRELMPKAA